jgi:hypothetical protein
MLRSWLDTWAGVGHILDARSADGYYVELRQSVFEFYREAMHHSHIGPARVAGNDPRRGPFFTWRNAGTLCQFAKARQQASAQSLACHESADNHLERLSAPVTSETTPCVDPHKTQGAGDGRVSDTARAIVANVSPTISGVISSLVLIHKRYTDASRIKSTAHARHPSFPRKPPLPQRFLPPHVQALHMEEHGHVGVEDLMLDLTGVDRLAAHAARTVSPEPDPWADPGDTWEGACAQGGSDPLPDGQCIRSARDHFFPLHRVEVQSSLASTDSRSKACLGGRRRGPSPTVAFGNPHAVTTHVQPIPPAPLHLKLILQLGRPDPSIASETEAIAPISNRGFAGLFPGKLSRCQLVADVIGEAVVRHNGHPKGLNGAVPLKRWEVTFAPKPHPFKLPRSKAPDVGVKLVQS